MKNHHNNMTFVPRRTLNNRVQQGSFFFNVFLKTCCNILWFGYLSIYIFLMFYLFFLVYNISNEDNFF